jgi:hypothetical protein
MLRLWFHRWEAHSSMRQDWRKYARLPIPCGLAFAMIVMTDELAIASGVYSRLGSLVFDLRGALLTCTRITLR